MKRKLKHYTKLLKEGKIELSDVQRSIAGWLGYVKHANSYNFSFKNIVMSFNTLFAISLSGNSITK